MSMRLLSLFSGIGAFEKALDNLNIKYELVNYCEIDKFASRAYSVIHSVSEDKNLGDVRTIDTTKIQNIDLLTFGFPCFVAGTLVNTSKGLKPIETVEVGDVVVDHRGNENKVIRTTITSCNKVVRLKSSVIPNLQTTEEHPFYVYSNGEFQFKKVKDLTTNDYLTIPLNNNTNEPDSVWKGCVVNRWGHNTHQNKLPLYDSRFWYLIGRLIGDGWVRHRKNRGDNNVSGVVLSCGFHKLEKLKESITDLFNYTLVKDRTSYKLFFSNKELGEFFSMFGKGASGKFIPKNILDLDVEFLKPMFDGYFDADGYFNKNNNTHSVATVSERLTYSLGELVSKVFKVPYSVYHTVRKETTLIEDRVVNQKPSFTVRFNISSPHQEKKHRIEGDYLLAKIKTILDEPFSGNVYNLEVENSHTYCVHNIATHNCTDISIMGERKGLVDSDGNKTRSGLVFDAFKVIEDTQPKVAIAENVLNLVATSFKDIFNYLVATLEQLGGGYNVYWQVLAANDYGIPQIRRRVFMVAIRKDVDDGEFHFPSPIPLRGVLADYLEDNADPKYTMSEQIKITFSDMTNRNGYVRGTIWQPHDLRTSKMAFTITTRQGSVPDQNYIIVGEPVYKEVVSDEINIFDTPTTEIDWTKTVVRRLTPLEAFRLMGFDDKDYDAVLKAGISNAQMYKMTGNSIVVPVVQHIIGNLLNYIGGKKNGSI